MGAVRSAWRNPSRNRGRKVALTSLVDAQPYVDLIALWTRHSNYLDDEGLPRALPLAGRNGFGSLVKRANVGSSSKTALATLLDYGNVETIGQRVVLTKPFFHIRSQESLAFEPSVRFLLDAASNVKSSLDRAPRKSRTRAEPFWRSVVSSSLPKGRRADFLAFVKASSLSFLQDIDDWLSQNADASAIRRDNVRVGLGLFTVDSVPEK